MEDFYGPISKLMHLYFEGASVSAEKKVQLFKLAWDLIGSPLGSRHELYERFYAGDPVRSFANQYIGYDKNRLIDPIWELLQQTSRGGAIRS
ncbi:4-hydroxyphenylacetate 3-monooxygenase oxygenase component [compost metagenome]